MENLIAGKFIEIIFAVVLGLAIYLFKKIVNDLGGRIDKLELNVKEYKSDMYEFKENYLDRFQKINDKINESEKKVLEKVNAVQIEIIKEISKLRNNNDTDN